MHEIRSEIKFATVLSTDDCSILNYDEYVEYLNDTIYSLTNDLEKKLSYNSDKFGDLKIILYMDQPLDDRDGEFEIRVKINDSRDNFNEDDWYDGLAEDIQFICFLEEQLVIYIKEINNIIKQIKYPINEDLIYKDGSLYMRISPINNKHIPIYVDFAIDTEVDTSQLFDNIWVN